MRDRPGQFTKHQHTRHMSNLTTLGLGFAFALLKCGLRAPSPGTLDDKRSQQKALESNNRNSCKDRGAVLLPNRLLFKEDLRPRREICLGEPPAFELPRIHSKRESRIVFVLQIRLAG